MRQRSFDLLLVDCDFSRDDYTALGAAFWAGSISGLAYVAPFEGELSEPSTFYKVLGYHPVSFEELLSVLKSLGASDPTASSPDAFPILVVEDLDSPRDIICIFIESLGFAPVTGVGSANEALTLLEEDPSQFKCIVTDIRMPKISGKEFIEIVRSHDRMQHIPIIVLTAFGTLDMLVDCLHLGASGFLVKPPKKADMLRELSRAVRISQNKEHPRLASHQEAEYIRKMVEEMKVT